MLGCLAVSYTLEDDGYPWAPDSGLLLHNVGGQPDLCGKRHKQHHAAYLHGHNGEKW